VLDALNKKNKYIKIIIKYIIFKFFKAYVRKDELNEYIRF